MKKITLFLVAMTMSLLSFAAQPKRIYAYDLSSALVDKVYTFSFTANETPTSGKIIFYDATSSELVGEIALTNPVLGKNEVEIAEYSLPGNDGQQLNWAVELSAAAVTAYEKIFADASYQYRRGFSNVDISPESDYFGTVYVADWCKTKTNSKIYVYNPVYSKSATGYNPGSPSAGWGCSRFTIAPNGNLWLTDYSDGHSGLFLVDPADLTKATQFFAGTRASSGLIKKGDVEVGSSLSCATLYGTGANTKLVTVAEDYTGKSFPVAVFNVGQEDGSLATSWTTAPNILFNTLGNAAQIFDVKACEKGVWVATNRGTGSNDSGATSLRFYTWDGACTWSSHEHTDIINGNLGGGIAITPDEKQIVMKIHDNNIAVFDITWNEDTPTLTTNATFNCGYAAVSAINLDYAGNIVTVAGTNFGNTDTQRMSLVVYSNPTANNTCEVPAKKADVVTKVEAAVTLYTITTNINDPIMGSVSGNLGTYEDGAPAELTAVANEHYEFVNWTGDVTSTDNPLVITSVNSDLTVTANFAKKQYTLTVQANDPTKGSVALDPAGSTYEYETEVTLTATANDGYEFVNWNNGSKANPLTIKMEEDTELTANFRAILPTSITLYAHPTKDYSTSIVGTMKRAIQNGENTIVLTHEANGTAHIYNIAHATKTVTEISQEGVNAAADGFLSISDIAVTEDGKLVACNSVNCSYTPSGTNYFYIWNNLAGNPEEWFTSQSSANYTNATVGGTMAVKGISSNAEVFVLAVTTGATKAARYIYHTVKNGTPTTIRNHGADNMSYLAVGNTYELNASPLSNTNWIIDGELIAPMEFEKTSNATTISTTTSLDINILGKKYNGASYLFHKDHHLMIAPYAADDKLAGVKVLGITDGFGSAVEVTTSTNLASAINAEAAAATAYVDGDGDLTIYLFADSKVFTFSEKVYTAQTFTVTATAGEGGSVEGGGTYEEGATATLTATPDKHYTFTGWSGYVTSTDNPLTITVNSAVELTASFTEDAKSTITVTSIDENMGTVSGSGTYYEGETVTLSAIAKGGYTFVKWNDEETAATRTITVGEDDATYTAHFKQATSRAWAYDLTRTENGENYDFTFKTTSAGTATLIFKDKDGTTLDFGEHTATATTAEEKTITIVKSVFDAATKDIYWEVELAGDAIAKMAELTDPTKGVYDIVAPQGIAVDNNTNSDYFGQVYVAAASDGTVSRGAQTRGIFVYNPILNELNSPNAGYLPANATLTSNTRQAIHRVAVNPTNNQVAFAYNISGSTAVWSMNPENLAGDAVDLIEGAGITKANSLCFDESGALYVMDNANTGTGGKIYKIQDGVASVFADAQTGNIWGVEENAMTPDGRGGLWIAQNRWSVDDYPVLSHVNSNGQVDFAVSKNSSAELQALFPYDDNNASYRGQCAYYVADDILAFAGNKEAVLFKITYDANDVPTNLEKLMSTGKLGTNIDGVAFDYAGDLYVASETTHRFYKFVVPTNDNTCTVPAPKSEFIEKEQKYTVTVEASPAEGGTVSDGGEYTAGETITLTATAKDGYRFINWTKGAEVLTAETSFTYTVPAEDVTLIANFELITYTLITSTNDENKGTVSVDGVCTHGSTVTLTATPKVGYKLLYWSDRSTENPRTITMTKNEAISAYFVKEYDVEPTFTITKVWENTQVPGSADGYQAVGWDGKIYMQNKTAGKIKVYSNGTDAAVDYATSNTSGQQIAVDEAGNLIVFNAYFATATPSAIQIYKNGSTTGTAISFTLPHPERCDFISASGDIYSAEGGYVYFYCQKKNAVNRVKITNGALASVDAIGNTANPATSVSHVMVDIFGNLAAHCRSTAVYAINSYTGETTAFNASLSGIKLSTLGGCSFELGGKELWAYNVGTTHYNSEWNLYNMTDKVFMSNETLYAKDKVSKKELGSSNWLNVQVVDENTAYIYQFCPEVAVAVWKVSIETEVNVTIDENADNTTTLTPYEGEVVNATVNRNFGANKILTVTLPFDMDATQISTFFGMATIYEFHNVVDAGEELHLQFSRTTSIEAGKPYIIQTAASGYDAEDGFTIEGVTVTTDLTPIELNGITMVPVLDGGGRLENANEYFLSNSALYCAGDYPRDLQGLRAYFTSNSSKTLRARVVFDDNEETSLPTITNPNNNVQKIVKNGQLIIIRGENQYNAQGQTISIE